MSEGGDSKWGTAFFLGFLRGVFVCLGAGGTFVLSQQRRLHDEVEQARMEAERARDQARAEQARAESERQAAEEVRRAALEERARAEQAVRRGKDKGD